MYLEISNPMDYHVALYIRLSKEDESEGPSESVNNQQSLLNEFIQQHRLTVFDTYIDESIILGLGQEVLVPQGFPGLVLIFMRPWTSGPYGRLIEKCVELSPSPIRRAA